MKKWFLVGSFILITTLQSCMVIGGVFRAGFKMGIYSVLLFVGLIIWVISKRSNNRK